jgi:hypothetical protein
VLAELPDTGDLDELFDWAVRGQPYRDGGLSSAEFDAALSSASWLQVVETSAFWGSDALSLHRATAACLSGLAHIGCPLAVVVRGGASGLQFILGAPHAAVLRASLEAHWPGVELRAVARPSVQGGTDCSLWLRHPVPAVGQRATGSSSSTPAGRATGLGADAATPSTAIERLAEVPTGRSFQVELLLRPVPVDVLRDRAAALAVLAASLRRVSQHQVQVESHVSAVVEDRVPQVLADEVDIVGARIQRMLGSGGLLLSGRLTTWSADDLAVVAGSLVGHVDSRMVWGVHPRTVPALPVTLLAADDAADAVSPPRHDVLGLPSRRALRLDEHPDGPIDDGAGSVVLGRTRRGAEVRVGMGELCSHLLVTGASGSGKSTALAGLLSQLDATGVPFAVVEPVKREWLSWGLSGLRTWCPGSAHDHTGWALNPLEVPDGIEVGTHLDQLVALFRGAYSLPDPLPHLLELALVRAYEQTGCDLAADRRPNDQRWPTMSSVLTVLAGLPAELGYEPQIRANLRAAAVARLGGLVRGARGRVLNRDQPFPVDEALTGPLVVNLDAIGDDQARSLFMALFVLRLAEERRVRPHRDLQHVTVLEEAHRLLPARTAGVPDGSGSVEGGAVTHGASVVADLMAEVRSSGEGMVVVDQSASMLVRSAVVNTSTKLALRTVDRSDQSALGAAMGLDDDELVVFSTLRDHEAVVTTASSDRPLVVETSWVAFGNATTPIPVAAPSTSPALTTLPPPVRRAAEVVVRVRPSTDRAGDPRAVLLEEIADAWPDITDEDTAAVVRNVLDATLAPVDSARRWPRGRRESAVFGAAIGSPPQDHPLELLLDGRRPRLSCRVVCPAGGCLTGELVEPAVERLLAQPTVVHRMLADPEECRRRIRREAEHLLGDEAPEDLLDHTSRCVVASVFDDVVDVATVRGLVATVGDGTPGGSHVRSGPTHGEESA